MSFEYEYEDGKDAWKRYRRTIESIDPEVQTILHEFGAAQFGYGYAAGLDAARAAVVRLQHKPGASIVNAVSAIDALSENPDEQQVSENPNDAR